MRINTNIASLNAQRQMQRSSQALQRSLERLSSGQRVNYARDDASGLARGVNLDSQVRAFNRALLNMNEANGVLMTAEGVMQSQMDLVQRMRELTVQATNGILSANDRMKLDQQLQSLMAEFNRLTKETQFNGQALLDGSFGSQKIQVGSAKEQNIDLKIDSMKASEIFTKDVGSGTFANATQINSSSNSSKSSSQALIDLDQDGQLDLVIGSFTGGVSVHLGNGDGSFVESKTYFTDLQFSSEIKFGDVTGDGKLDLIGVTNEGVTILTGEGDGSFSEKNTFGSSDIVDLELADFNNDGRLDIASFNTDSENAFVHINNGNGSFTNSLVAGLGYGNGEVLVGDFNQDGNQDIVVAGNSPGVMNLYQGSGAGTFALSVANFNLGSTSHNTVISADLDNDGDLDIVALNSSSLRISLNNGNGTFTLSPTSHSVGPNATNMAITDLNDDGRLDIAVLNSGSSISILLGQGSGKFSAGTPRSLSGGSSFLISAGDLNGDEAPDLVSTPSLGDKTSIYQAQLKEVAADHEVKITTVAQAQKLLGILDNALQNISQRRSDIGALQNRLGYAESVTSLSRENLSAARSQVLDADLAEETAEVTRLQVMQQAQASVLAQANFSLRLALQLLTR